MKEIIKKAMKSGTKTVNNIITYQTTSMANVKPEYKFRVEQGKDVFYLNSPAGLIIYKTKKYQESAKFRNDVLNKFSQLIANDENEKEYFKLVKYIRENYKVEYKANMHTRLKGFYVF